MNENEYIVFEELKEQFSTDRLFIEVLKDGIEEKTLFPGFVQKLMVDKLYTSLEVAGMIGVKDQLLRYYLKQLYDYIQPIKQNRVYRYNYKMVYRLYLITLFLNVEGRNLNDVKAIVYGIKLNNNAQQNDWLNERLATIERNINRIEWLGNLYVENDLNLNNIDNKIEKLEATFIEWNQLRRKVVEIDMQLHNLGMAYYDLKTAIFETERRLLCLENEFFQGILNLEFNNRLLNIENIIREKNMSLFKKLSLRINHEANSLISEEEPNLISIQKEITKEKELLKKLVNDFEEVQSELKKMGDLKKDILNSIDFN